MVAEAKSTLSDISHGNYKQRNDIYFLNKIPYNSENKLRGLNFSKVLFEGLSFGGAYMGREICVSKSARLILGGKYSSQNPLG